jgi:hypothetical protein
MRDLARSFVSFRSTPCALVDFVQISIAPQEFEVKAHSLLQLVHLVPSENPLSALLQHISKMVGSIFQQLRSLKTHDRDTINSSNRESWSDYARGRSSERSEVGSDCSTLIGEIEDSGLHRSRKGRKGFGWTKRAKDTVMRMACTA